MTSKQYLSILVLISVNLITGLPLDKPYNVTQFTSLRIVGGQVAPEGYAPYMVALLMGDFFTFLMCGGSLISKKHVLTAAHCIDSSLEWEGVLARSLRGVVGSNRHASTENVITFSHYINHPKYDMFAIKYDVGVLFIAQDLKLSDNIAVISLKPYYVRGGEECHVTGWGRVGSENFTAPEQLQLLYVNTIGSQECVEKVYEASVAMGGGAPPVDPAVEICTLHSFGHGMCNGDSGSPLVLKKSSQLVGIVSWGFACARGVPDMYVRISGVWDFIEFILRGAE